jgi:hypothetical protein
MFQRTRKYGPFRSKFIDRATLRSIIYETIDLVVFKFLELVNKDLLSDRH